jgi:elongation factor Ts
VSAAENPQPGIPASLVKQLRDKTGAPMMDCKRALQESEGNVDAAEIWLRERGHAQAVKRADRTTTEGLVGTMIREDVGSIVGVGCETEPVSGNEEFQAFAEKALRTVHAEGPDAVATLEDERLALIGRLGENIVIVGAARFDGGGTLAAYVHPPRNKIGVLGALDGGTPELARQIAMHISFAAPQWTTRDEVPAEVIEAEKQIYLNSDEVQSKPEAAHEKIVAGMLGKRFYALAPGGVLVDQAWIHDQSKTVGDALAEAGASVTAFTRVSVAAS